MPLSSTTVVVRDCRCCCPPLPLLLSAVTVVVVRRRHFPLLPSSASTAVIATPCLRCLLPPTLVRPLCSPLPNFLCCCRPLLSLSAFAVIVHRRHLPLPQPSSPLRCLHRLSPPAIVFPHCSLLPNHACCCCPPPSSSASIIAIAVPPLILPSTRC